MNENQFDNLLGYLGEANLHSVKQYYDPSVYPYPSDLGGYSQWWWMAIRVVTTLTHSLVLLVMAHSAHQELLL